MNRLEKIRLAAITGGRNVPSARFRVRGLISGLEKYGIEVDEFIPDTEKYPPIEKKKRPLWLLKALKERAPMVIDTYKYDITLFQREMISTLLTFEPFTSRPRILDVDDAVFLNSKVNSIKYLSKLCDLIICGNSFLADWFSLYNSNIAIIPTGVDIQKYKPSAIEKNSEKIIIGWIGTNVNLKYLYEIESSLFSICDLFKNVKLKIISDIRPQFKRLREESVEFIKWTEKNEIKDIQSMDIGIMPLDDSLWSRGKCSFKMLQYMSCCIPVVASPVGMNNEVLSNGGGYLARSKEDWCFILEKLILDADDRKKMGTLGRTIVKKNYSTELVTKLFANSVSRLVG